MKTKFFFMMALSMLSMTLVLMSSSCNKTDDYEYSPWIIVSNANSVSAIIVDENGNDIDCELSIYGNLSKRDIQSTKQEADGHSVYSFKVDSPDCNNTTIRLSETEYKGKSSVDVRINGKSYTVDFEFTSIVSPGMYKDSDVYLSKVVFGDSVFEPMSLEGCSIRIEVGLGNLKISQL